MKKILSSATVLIALLLAGCGNQSQMDAKPVIYLYPEERSQVEVELDYHGELTCTYPEYKDGWKVIAEPNGTLTDVETGKEYSYLFWEGKSGRNRRTNDRIF